jgi:predicted nicotinamide N-methyase
MRLPADSKGRRFRLVNSIFGIYTSASMRGSIQPTDGPRTRAFLARRTRPRAPGLCPEIHLLGADSLARLWEQLSKEAPELGPGPPYWSVAWPGGEALARFVLDHPEWVRDASVLDLGTGSGIGAIAAARAGARRVVANDCDPAALLAVRRNAAWNSVSIAVRGGDLLGAPPPDGFDRVLAADLWFEPWLGRRVTPWLRRLAARGVTVLVADPGRGTFPRQGLERLAEYPIATDASLERGECTPTGVWRLLPGGSS